MFPASSFAELADLAIPTDSTGIVDLGAGGNETKYCEELLQDDSRCSKVALAQCVEHNVSRD